MFAVGKLRCVGNVFTNWTLPGVAAAVVLNLFQAAKLAIYYEVCGQDLDLRITVDLEPS